MTRRALIVGINTYSNAPRLQNAIADAEAIARLLERHSDGALNYECRVLLDRMENGDAITRKTLRQACQELFKDFKGDVVLFFSGHGALTQTGGYLCTSDAEPDDWGIPMQEILEIAIASPALDVLIILDCCHSGDFANPALLKRGNDPLAVLRENMTVVAASLPTQASVEAGGHGLFTAAVLDALDGGAADHMGWVTAPSVYTYVDRRFGAWGERPVYKSHTSTVTVVRECAPLIDRLKLHQLTAYFPTADYRFPLDPEFEPEDEHGVFHEPVNKEKLETARLFKEYRDAGLLRPSEAGEQLFWTARRGHSVELTPRGREYWNLVKKKKI